MTTSFVVADRLAKVGAEIITAQMKGVNEAANVLRDLAEVNTRIATGGDLRLGGVWKLGAPNPAAKVSVRMSPARSAERPEAYVRGAPGYLYNWIEYGTRQHWVGGGKANRTGGLVLASSLRSRTVRRVGIKGKLNKAAERKVMRGDEGPRSGPWIAGGSPAYKPFTRALRVVGPKVPEIVQRETRRAITRAGFK